MSSTTPTDEALEKPRPSRWRAQLDRWGDEAALHPDLGRGMRAMIAFMGPLLFSLAGSLPIEVSFVAIAAQNIAMVDMRGDYRLRFLLLLAMVAVFAGAAAMGATVADNAPVAVLATGLMAVAGGVWRHLSADYGPPLAISSTLVFFLALAAPQSDHAIGDHALAALAGGLWGVAVQVAIWPFRPQHALRRTTADSWLAVGTLCDALAASATGSAQARAQVVENENLLRTALDQTYASLAAAPAGALRQRLEALNLVSARLATRIVALDTALDSIPAAGDRLASIRPVIEPVLQALGNLSRNAAIAVVSRQPAHLAAFEVRLRTVTSLLGVLRRRLRSDPAFAQPAAIVAHVERTLPEIHAALRATVERAEERGAVSFELRDLGTRALRPLASALNLGADFDPALIRYTLRLAALTMIGAAVFTFHALPHGYWLPFTAVVVLQPDYGSTRQRASQRTFGTLAGSVLASLLLWVSLPWAVLMGATAFFVFGFAYFLKRNYTWAIFCVTVFIVLITEAREPVSIAFTLERLGITVAGGALALAAAFLFWPVWERDRLPSILGQTFRANRDFLTTLLDRVSRGGSYDAGAIAAKRRAEAANSAAFSSLRRMSGDPKDRREGLEAAASLVHGNQRLTRTLNVLALHLAPGDPIAVPAIARFAGMARDAFDHLAASVEGGAVTDQAVALQAALEAPLAAGEAASERERWILEQLGRTATELSALLQAVGPEVRRM